MSRPRRRPLAGSAVAVPTAGCLASTPYISATPDRRLFAASELSFIREGETTRERMLLELGNPASRILGPAALQDWPPGSDGLMLVFRDDLVLRTFSLVGSE